MMKKNIKLNIGLIKFILISLLPILFMLFFIKRLYCNCWFDQIVYTKEVDPIAVFNIIITVIVAFWASYYISKKLTEDRFIKEFVINDVAKIEEEIYQFEKLIIQNKSIELQVIFDSIHQLKNKVDRFQKATEILGLKCRIMDDLNKYHTKLFQVSTDCETGIVELGDKKVGIESICSDIILTLRSIVSTINKK